MGGPIGWPVAASQSRAVSSCAPGEDGLAVGAERHGRYQPGCGRGGPMGRPVAASQSRAVLSSQPVRMVLPSGLNATDATMPGCDMGWPMGRPVAASQSRAVLSPHPVRIGLAVGAERHRPDRRRMHHGLADGPAGGGVPQPRRAVAARR